MRTFIIPLIFLAIWGSAIVQARTIEIDVHGMTCAFCVDTLQRTFTKFKTVSKVEVSLKHKKIRLETEGNLPSVDTLKQTVLDAGFTPLNIAVQ